MQEYTISKSFLSNQQPLPLSAMNTISTTCVGPRQVQSVVLQPRERPHTPLDVVPQDQTLAGALYCKALVHISSPKSLCEDILVGSDFFWGVGSPVDSPPSLTLFRAKEPHLLSNIANCEQHSCKDNCNTGCSATMVLRAIQWHALPRVGGFRFGQRTNTNSPSDHFSQVYQMRPSGCVQNVC
eukprot:774464-Amphidinium_carterae.2